ncbi:MAG: transposase [Planctomycetaceae bacterium]
MYQYIGGIIREQNGHLVEIGEIEDHLHVLSDIHPTRAVSDTIRDIKASASKWINELPEARDRFEWQKGYSAFTVSYSQSDSVQDYVRNQQEHHRRKSFEQEYVSFLNRHEIIFDPRYLFEQEHHG